MSFINWIFDTLANRDIIDLNFILSDLKDIEITEAESCESAFYDSMTSCAVDKHKQKKRVPIGKTVI